MCLKDQKKTFESVKNKHIVQLVKSSFNNECILMTVPEMADFVKSRVVEFLQTYLSHVTPLLLEKVLQMHRKLAPVEKQYLESND